MLRVYLVMMVSHFPFAPTTHPNQLVRVTAQGGLSHPLALLLPLLAF